MRGINKVILIGNATRDAELRHTETGKAVSSIRLATNRMVRGEEESQFHTIVCWEGLAETTATYVKKGDPLYVEGRLQYRAFQRDEEGREQRVTEIVASDVQFLSRRKDGPTPTEDASPNPSADATDPHDVSPDEIPF
jgi:single-strand DNA-binding protein